MGRGRAGGRDPLKRPRLLLGWQRRLARLMFGEIDGGLPDLRAPAQRTGRGSRPRRSGSYTCRGLTDPNARLGACLGSLFSRGPKLRGGVPSTERWKIGVRVPPRVPVKLSRGPRHSSSLERVKLPRWGCGSRLRPGLPDHEQDSLLRGCLPLSSSRGS